MCNPARNVLYAVLILLSGSMFMLVACKKESDTTVLRGMSKEVLKKYLTGKWEYTHEINGWSGQRIALPPGNILQFSFSRGDSAFLYHYDTLMISSGIIWRVQEFNREQITVMSGEAFGFAAPGTIKEDTLSFFVPGADGGGALLRRLK